MHSQVVNGKCNAYTTDVFNVLFWFLKPKPNIFYSIFWARWVDAPAETIFGMFVSTFQSRWRSVMKANLQWDWLEVGCKNQYRMFKILCFNWVEATLALKNPLPRLGLHCSTRASLTCSGKREDWTYGWRDSRATVPMPYTSGWLSILCNADALRAICTRFFGQVIFFLGNLNFSKLQEKKMPVAWL